MQAPGGSEPGGGDIARAASAARIASSESVLGSTSSTSTRAVAIACVTARERRARSRPETTHGDGLGRRRVGRGLDARDRVVAAEDARERRCSAPAVSGRDHHMD